MFSRFVAWAKRNLPTRESMEANRWLRPVAHRVLEPSLWRFTRRSVPRGVALGMVTGILCPVAQVPLSAIFALPVRANIPVAALTTFITNPFTTPPLWVAAYWIGSRILHFGEGMGVEADAARGWMEWLFSEAGPSLVVGLTLITLVFAVVGYGASALGWRWWIVRKWRARAEARAA
ncbi:DUF2062 domain-containing protein [Sphingomonas immobilis]|uniref:DUF2062 domain-containing protein n=1 Tax=Sphingomonas immobilis TaxID=3063997 RepID=A0ABT9A4K6_9SPHN|nr:DUF2062 domain-containing protein [Sphingomonas sp. CA1-15]MDO7844367.1 DUF2062 domain-containing protein [Sphingomonas sp. CA1-15]